MRGCWVSEWVEAKTFLDEVASMMEPVKRTVISKVREMELWAEE